MNKLIQLRNILRATVLSSAVVLTLGGGAALASVDLSGSNDTTGPNSENENEWEVESDVDIEVDNNVDSDFDIYADVHTGHNDFEHNTEIGDIETGSVMGEVVVENELNSSSWDWELPEVGDVDIEFGNSITGPYSENQNKVDIDWDADIDVDNCAEIDNDFHIYPTTGKNNVEHNTVVGDVRTGDIEMNGSVKNMVNSNGAEMILPSMGSNVSIEMSNDTTGPNSENENEVDIDSDLDIDISNRADIDNHIRLEADSGTNDVEHNTVVGDIRTGDISFDWSVVNKAN